MIAFAISTTILLASIWCLIKGDMDMAIYYAVVALWVLFAGRY